MLSVFTFHRSIYSNTIMNIFIASQWLNRIGPEGYTACGLAAQLGFFPLLKFLCEQGGDINGSNKYGQTPLFEVAKNSRWSQKRMERGLLIIQELKPDCSHIDRELSM